MVTTYGPTDDPHVVLLGDLTNQILCPQSQITFQRFVVILCHPHRVLLDVVNRMRPFSIVYGSSLLTSAFSLPSQGR